MTAFMTVDRPATEKAPGRCTKPVTYTRTPRRRPTLALSSKFLNTCATRLVNVGCRSAKRTPANCTGPTRGMLTRPALSTNRRRSASIEPHSVTRISSPVWIRYSGGTKGLKSTAPVAKSVTMSMPKRGRPTKVSNSPGRPERLDGFGPEEGVEVVETAGGAITWDGASWAGWRRRMGPPAPADASAAAPDGVWAWAQNGERAASRSAAKAVKRRAALFRPSWVGCCGVPYERGLVIQGISGAKRAPGCLRKGRDCSGRAQLQRPSHRPTEVCQLTVLRIGQ